ncbi:MAG: DUF1772 domain-containing protein [Dermatophilus congolensis]|nr:DUF1772 domain-containing protein [Dermatophilus congolensis]
MSALPAVSTRLSVSDPFRTEVPARLAAVVSVLLFGASFGFFYAWVCSTMWGLDATDPRTAIAAMQAMNANVRNPVFFVIFFLPPVAGAVTALLAWSAGYRRAALVSAVSSLVYAAGVIYFTSAVNLPMNDALAAVVIPSGVDEAARIWRDYSQPWQVANITRTVFSGIALTGIALTVLDLGRNRIGGPR